MHPAGAMFQQMRAAHQGTPERHLALIGRLRVDLVRGRDIRGSEGHADMTGELARGLRGLDVFGRSEGRRAGAHVDVGGEAAIQHRRAGPHDLGQHDPRHRLGMLLDQRPGQRHRRHRARQREGRDRQRLAMLGHRDQPLGHRDVELQRRVGVDDAEKGGPVRQALQAWSRARSPPSRSRPSCGRGRASGSASSCPEARSGRGRCRGAGCSAGRSIGSNGPPPS